MLELAATAPRAQLAEEWRRYVESLDLAAPANVHEAAQASALYKTYLSRCQREAGLGLLQPGRFTMPADVADADLLGFCPLPLGRRRAGSLRDLMGRRYDRYCDEVVAPSIATISVVSIGRSC